MWAIGRIVITQYKWAVHKIKEVSRADRMLGCAQEMSKCGVDVFPETVFKYQRFVLNNIARFAQLLLGSVGICLVL